MGLLQASGPRVFFDPRGLPFTPDPMETLRVCAIWAGYASALIAGGGFFRDERRRRGALWFFAGLGVAISVVGIIQASAGNTAYYGLRRIRHGEVFGPYTDRDNAGDLLMMSLAVALGLLATQWRWTSEREKVGDRLEDISRLAVMAVPAGIISVGLWATRSRGAIVSLYSALLFLLVGRAATARGQRRRAAIVAAAATAFGGITFATRLPWIVGFGSNWPDHSTAYRLSIWASAWRQFQDFPLWGAGLGTAMRAFPAYKNPFVIGIVEHAHDDWLEILLEVGGVAGVLGILGIWRSVGTLVRRAIVPRDDGNELPFSLAVAVLAFVLHSFVDFNLHIPANGAVFFFLLGLLAAALTSTNGSDLTSGLRRLFLAPVLLGLWFVPGEIIRWRQYGMTPAAAFGALEAVPPSMRTPIFRRTLIRRGLEALGEGRIGDVRFRRRISWDAQMELAFDPASPVDQGLFSALEGPAVRSSRSSAYMEEP